MLALGLPSLASPVRLLLDSVKVHAFFHHHGPLKVAELIIVVHNLMTAAAPTQLLILNGHSSDRPLVHHLTHKFRQFLLVTH